MIDSVPGTTEQTVHRLWAAREGVCDPSGMLLVEKRRLWGEGKDPRQPSREKTSEGEKNIISPYILERDAS